MSTTICLSDPCGVCQSRRRDNRPSGWLTRATPDAAQRLLGAAEPDPEGTSMSSSTEREWDGADSDAHQARVEAGEITQYGEPREPGLDEWVQAEAG